MKKGCSFIGNGITAAAISERLSVDWLCVPSLSKFPLFASTIDSKAGGNITLEVGEEYTPVYQRYLNPYNILETGCKTSKLKVVSIDSMVDNKRALIRDVDIENISGSLTVFIPKVKVNPTMISGHSVVVKNLNNLIVVSDEKLCFIIGTSKPIKEIALKPGQVYKVRIIVAFGESYVESQCNFWDVMDFDVSENLRARDNSAVLINPEEIIPTCYAMK
ncbi:trehalase-like domain-containing protein [Caldanaerobius polysaccharolyticus]|uniref:trehalase-like domain-containing protein n=1 Tax=Caldanaerobius polysaccharolyticus TaxID=44256 RepID=UPI00047D3D82|nr:trehalase-like domain-containing protein [Caldanaerobius polysaccharolyticus]